MEIPLLLLAVGALGAGFVPVPRLLGETHAAEGDLLVTGLAVAVALAGAAFSLHRYRHCLVPPKETKFSSFLTSGFGLDRVVDEAILAPFAEAVERVKTGVEKNIREGAFGVTQGGIEIGEGFSSFQTGQVSHYLAYLVGGAAFFLFWLGRG